MTPNDFLGRASFTAIDFETAHGQPWSICQVGLVRVQDGAIVREIELLVQPPGNHYHWGNSRVHGLTRRDTAHAPLFPEIWPQIAPFIEDQHVVAHNAAFDCTCLRRTLAFYQMPEIRFTSHCTVKIYKRNLASLCQEHHIELNHHQALSDARACALLFLRHLGQTVS